MSIRYDVKNRKDVNLSGFYVFSKLFAKISKNFLRFWL